MTALESSDVRFVPLADTSEGGAGEGPAPWVDIPGGTMRVLRASLETGEWVVHNTFQPGFTAPRHKHTGHIDAYTIRGRWEYLEYGIAYEAGSYVFEPALSVHTLHVPEDAPGDAEVIFIMRGANLNLDENDNVESVTDAGSVLAAYRYLCEAQGKPAPQVLG